MALHVERLYEAYRLLGVSSGCSLSEITKAYRKLAKKYHPDSNPHTPSSSHEMMMRINEAYRLIKDSYEYRFPEPEGVPRNRKAGSVKEDWKDDYQDRTLWVWLRRFEREREEEKIRQQMQQERIRRESEALKKFWEQIIIQRKYEVVDRKVYEVIKKYAYALVSYFYKKNFHNTLAIRRAYLQRDFEDYIDKFKRYMRRIRTLAESSRSKEYRRKSLLIYKFLKSFILDEVENYPTSDERRASAFDNYQSTTRDLQRFLGFYFSTDNVKKEVAQHRFREALFSFESFLRTYPDSPLIECAKSKIEVLENFFLAYLKG
jgi:hypothetical protein